MRKTLGIFLALVLIISCAEPASADIAPKGYLALTFDDGPSGAVTERLLDGLSSRNARATFFVCGYRAAQYPDVLSRIVNHGHELGLHSSCHCYMQRMTKEEALSDLIECQISVVEACGITPKLFRPPGGLYSGELLKAAGELDLAVILWSVDPCDWDAAKEPGVLPFLLSSARSGDIILMHDLTDTSVKNALSFVDAMQKAGYEFVTVSELAALNGKTLLPGEKYSAFRR